MIVIEADRISNRQVFAICFFVILLSAGFSAFIPVFRSPDVALSYEIATIAVIISTGAACFWARRMRMKALAEGLLENGLRAKATIKKTTAKTERYLRSRYGTCGQELSLLMTYEFAGNASEKIDQEVKIYVLFGVRSYANPTPDIVDKHQYLFVKSDFVQWCIASGRQIDIYALWQQFRALKDGDTLSVVYKPGEPSVNYPEAYLQALAELKG